MLINNIIFVILFNNLDFNGHEIFHILENENRPDADIFIALDPFGKVIRAEVADFYTSKK